MNLLRIAWGDLRRVAKDRRALPMLLAAPLLFAFLVGSATSGLYTQRLYLPIADLDQSELSGLFAAQMEEEGYQMVRLTGPKGERGLKTGFWGCGVAIPRGFGASILKGEPVTLTVLNVPGPAERLLDVQSCLAQAIVRFTKALALAEVNGRAWTEARKQALQEALTRAPLLSVERKAPRSLRAPQVGIHLSLPGFLVLFVLLMIMLFGGTTLLEDRTHGQLARLIAAPMSAFEVYLGKILARVLLAMLQSVLLLGCGAWLFHLEVGEAPLFLLPVIFCLAVVAGLLSLLCGLVCRTARQVTYIALFVAVMLAALGGCLWPIEFVPGVFGAVARFTPGYWGLHGLQSVMYFGKAHEVLVLDCPILLGFAAVVMGVALPILRRRTNQAQP
jgi:ABC-2 type transport system permease protein